MTSVQPARILLADDHALVRSGLRMIIDAEPDLRVVAEAEGAAVVHCAAGKDRTGTVVAMALSVAGASDEVISADYLATGERIERVVERLMTIPAYADNLSGRALAEHTPSPDTMPRLLAAIRDTAGSVEGWLRQNGWTEADVAQLRARLTRP